MAETNSDADEEFSNLENEVAELTKENNPAPAGVMRRNENIDNGNKDNKVIVEPRNIIPVTTSGKMEMVPYRMRRKSWGKLWGISYGTFTPEDYELDQIPAPFADYYPAPSMGLLSVEFILKKNFDSLSMGLIGSAGYFQQNQTLRVLIQF